MSAEERIIRIKDKTENFSVIYNACFRDKTISMQAMGLFAYLMTLPNDWEIHKEELVSHFSNGRDAVYKAFDELVEKGFIVVEEIKGEKGHFGKKVYKVFEVSQGETKIVRKPRAKRTNTENEEPKDSSESTVTEQPLLNDRNWKSVTGSPLTEKPTLLNTNKQITDKPNTDELITDNEGLSEQEENNNNQESKSHCCGSTATKNNKKRVSKPKPLSKSQQAQEFLNTLSEKEQEDYKECARVFYNFKKSIRDTFETSEATLICWQSNFAKCAEEFNVSSNEILNTLIFAISSDYWKQYMFSPDNFRKSFEKLYQQKTYSNQKSNTSSFKPKQNFMATEKYSLGDILGDC